MSGIIGTSHSKSKVIGRSIDTAKAWVKFAGNTNTGGYCTINSSFNVSSVADNGTGNYTVNFNKDFANADFCLALSSQGGSGHSHGPIVRHDNDSSTGNYATILLFTVNTASTKHDTNGVYLVAWGD